MRVIAGAYGGRRLTAPRGTAVTRPTADRVREALFSILGELSGLRVLDLFAGSGALGIEALSRGAASAVFVERAAPALAALRSNLAALELERPAAVVRAGEVQSALRGARRDGDTYDLIFIDPPYRLAGGLGQPLSEPLAAVLAAGGRLVAESDRRAPLELELPIADERCYGDTLIRIHHDFTKRG